MQGFTAKFGGQPDAYNGRAYDTFILLAAVMRQFGVERDRRSRRASAKIKDVPSVVFGTVNVRSRDASRCESDHQSHQGQERQVGRVEEGLSR